MKVTIEIEGVDGKKAKVALVTEAPKLRTITPNGIYTLEGLMTLAKTGSLKDLDEGAKKMNTALEGVSKETAVKILADAFAAGSEFLKEAKAPKDGE
jgi:hypothetical protein